MPAWGLDGGPIELALAMPIGHPLMGTPISYHSPIRNSPDFPKFVFFTAIQTLKLEQSWF
jgi:hypothetical protein